MQKTILMTGPTDGIVLEAASVLALAHDSILLHGRNPVILEAAEYSPFTMQGDFVRRGSVRA